MTLSPERKAKLDNLSEEELREEHALGRQYARFQGESYSYIGARLAIIDRRKSDAHEADVKTRADAANSKTWRFAWWQVAIAVLGIVVTIAIFYCQR